MTKAMSFAAVFAVLAFMVATTAAANTAPKPGKAAAKHAKKSSVTNGCEVHQLAWSPLPSIPLGGGQQQFRLKILLWASCWTTAQHTWKWNFSFPGSNFAPTSSTDVFPVVNVPSLDAEITGTVTVGASGKNSASCKFTINGADPPRLPGEPIFPPHGLYVC